MRAACDVKARKLATQGMVHVVNRQRRRVAIGKLTKFSQAALAACRALRAPGQSALKTLASINVVLVSDKRIAEIHRQFMGIAGPTDVITFEHGEIVISVETAARQARAFESSLHRELCLYAVHGLLHLHGFDDRTARDAARMTRRQKRIVADLV